MVSVIVPLCPRFIGSHSHLNAPLRMIFPRLFIAAVAIAFTTQLMAQSGQESSSDVAPPLRML